MFLGLVSEGCYASGQGADEYTLQAMPREPVEWDPQLRKSDCEPEILERSRWPALWEYRTKEPFAKRMKPK